VFERHNLEIFGPVHCKEGSRIGNNDELQKLIKGEYINYIKAYEINWWGHINGMEEIKLVKKITD
jgi:hypothetical protein